MQLLPERYDAQRRRAGIPTGVVALAIVAVWLVPALLAAFETAVFWRLGGQARPLWLALVLQVPQWLAYALLTPFILHASESRLIRGRGRVGAAIAHATLALAAGVVYAFVAALTWQQFSPTPMPRPFAQMMLSWYLSGLPLIALSYFAIVGGARALYWFARGRDAELASAQLGAQLAGARLDALRMQLNPHFLFNTLNAVTVLVRDHENEAAARSLELLSGLLRDSLRADARRTIPLGEELDFVRRYLAIEQVRFPDRLRVQYDVPAALESLHVPAMILQPLIENAIRHGIRQYADAGLLVIRARADGGMLELTVEDDGGGPGAVADDVHPGADARSRRSGGSSGSGSSGGSGTGVGLTNTRERLRVLYGDGGSVALYPREGRGARAVVRIPSRTRHDA